MKATIWHNPKCGTSRKTLAILEETPGVDVEVIQYLKTPYSADKLRQLFRDAGLNARDALRLRGTDAEERGLPDADEDAKKSLNCSYSGGSLLLRYGVEARGSSYARTTLKIGSRGYYHRATSSCQCSRTCLACVPASRSACLNDARTNGSATNSKE